MTMKNLQMTQSFFTSISRKRSTVPHKPNIEKLKILGFGGKLLGTKAKYFLYRHEMVNINGISSV